MPQTTPTEADGIQFNSNGGNTIQVSSDTDGNLTFVDAVVSSAIKLVDLAGLESHSSVFVVGKKYATIQAALDAVSATSSVSNPSLILIPTGVYAESLTVQKDGVHLVGLGLVEITGTIGNPTVSIDDLGAVVPLSITFQNIIFSKNQDAEKAVSIVGTAATNLGLGGITFKDCQFKATGIGTFAVFVNIANTVIIEGGSTAGSSATAKFSVAQCSSFSANRTSEIPNVELSYDDSSDQPSTLTSSYSFAHNLLCGDFLVSLLGTGSLSVSNCTTGSLSVDGTQNISLARCSLGILTVSGTISAAITNSEYPSLSGDATATLDIDKVIDSVIFSNEASKTVSLPLPYPNSSYMVLIDSPVSDIPFVENKTTTTFDITYSGLVTVTATYQVIKF